MKYHIIFELDKYPENYSSKDKWQYIKLDVDTAQKIDIHNYKGILSRYLNSEEPRIAKELVFTDQEKFDKIWYQLSPLKIK